MSLHSSIFWVGLIVLRCNICGGMTYRGRAAMQKHYSEGQHTLGLRSLGLPNVRQFHGITEIEDAIARAYPLLVRPR